MNKNFVFFIWIIFTSLSSFSYSVENKMNEAKEMVINSHVEFAKAAIDKKCLKIKEKIKRLERNLYYIENNSECRNTENYIKLINKIQKYEEKIESLKLIKLSVDTINFNAL